VLVNGYVAKKEIASIKIFKTTEKQLASREAIEKMIAKEVALTVSQEESMEDQFSNQEKPWEHKL
jgi:hypothetical protein